MIRIKTDPEAFASEYDKSRSLAKDLLNHLRRRFSDLDGPPSTAIIAAGILYAGMTCQDQRDAHVLLDYIYRKHGS